MPESYIYANGVRLAYEEFGNPDDPAIILIMGLGGQMIAWPDAFCERLTEGGYRVVRFDNRDIGRSQKMRGFEAFGLLRLVLLNKFGFTLGVPYTLDDMAEDTVSLMDSLNIPCAHIVGISMGGMIAQLIAANYPDKTLSLVSMMSTSGRPGLPGSTIEVKKMMLRPPPVGKRARVRRSMEMLRAVGSPAYLPSEEEMWSRIERGQRRSYYPMGALRQTAAIEAVSDRSKILPRINAPTLVIHGAIDPLIPVAAGIDTANLIPNAQLEIVNGLGHDFPAQLIPNFAHSILAHVDAHSHNDLGVVL